MRKERKKMKKYKHQRNAIKLEKSKTKSMGLNHLKVVCGENGDEEFARANKMIEEAGVPEMYRSQLCIHIMHHGPDSDIIKNILSNHKKGGVIYSKTELMEIQNSAIY